MEIQLNSDGHIDGTEALGAQVRARFEQTLGPGRRIAVSCLLSGRAVCPARTATFPGRIAASHRRNKP